MLTAVFIFIFILVIASVGVAVYFIRGGNKNIARERLFELRDAGKDKKKAAAGGMQEELDKSFFERIIQPKLEAFSKKMEKGKKKKADPVAELLIRAGNPGNLTSGQYQALRLLSAMISIVFIVFITLIGLLPMSLTPGSPPVLPIIFAAVAGGFSFILPQFWLKGKVTKRQKAMRKSLPDLLDLLTVSVEAGLGFDQAMQKVCERMHTPLTEEFDRMLQEVKLGSTRKDALKAVGARAQFPELDSLISAIIQADTLGVSIGQILRIQSDQLRTKRRQMIEEMAQKLPIKMLFPMIFFIFPTIFIVTLGPIALKVKDQM